MIKLLKKIHWAYSAFCILFFFIVFWPLYYIFTRNPRTYILVNWLRCFQAYIVTILSGIFFRFHFEEKLDPKQTYVYCANHTSNLDIIMFCMLAHGRFHFMGKDELLKNPVLGIFFKTIDVSVSRESKISSFRAFKKAGDNLEKGMSLIIFPEGKIDEKYPPILQEFKNGPFRLAVDKNIPIVPVSVNIWKMMWDDGLKYGTRPGIGEIYVHRPISTINLAADDSDVLKDEVFSKINSRLEV